MTVSTENNMIIISLNEEKKAYKKNKYSSFQDSLYMNISLTYNSQAHNTLTNPSLQLRFVRLTQKYTTMISYLIFCLCLIQLAFQVRSGQICEDYTIGHMTDCRTKFLQ